VFFGGALSTMASLSVLREDRASPMILPAMEVSLSDTGAHLAHLSRAVKGWLADLWSAGLFIERPAYDPQGVAIPQTRDFEISSNGRPSYRDFCPPADMRDIHICIGLDRGGDPSSVKFVIGFINQEHPKRLGSTLLVAVCPESKDKYPEVAAMLAPHVAQILRLRYTGVVVGGHRRAVRVFVNSDFPAITNTVGHKGPCCLGMKCPTKAHSLLDEAFGTLQDLHCIHPPRTAAHLREMQEAYEGLGQIPAELGLAAHMPVERSPVTIVPPSQIVPFPLHITIGITARPLRLAIEAVTQERGPVDGRQFAYQLAAILSVHIGVESVPYQGGNFIGRHCHTIASGCGKIEDALHPLVSVPRFTAYERAWELWRGVLSTLNRAALILPAKQARFKASARAFVSLLQGSFPWMSISPKLHVLFARTWEVMGLWGSKGLYGEQAIE